MAVLLVWTLVSGSRVKTFVNSADNTKSADSENSQDLNSIWLTIPNAQEVEIYNQCDFLSNSSSIFMAILITWNFSLTVSGAYLAIQIRQVTQALSDAVHVSFCIYNVIIVTLVCLPAILTVNNGATVSFIIQCTGLVAIAFSVLLLLFIPPLRSLRQQRKQKKDRMLEQSKSALSDDSKLSEYYEKAPSNARIFSSSVMVSSRDPYKESRSITVEDSLSGLSKAELLLEVEYLRNLVQDMKQQTFKRTEKPLGLDPAEDA